MARPLSYSAEAERKILDAVRCGNTRRAACAVAGISEDTLARWIRDSAKPPKPGDIAGFAGFADRLSVAKAQFETQNVAAIAEVAVPHDVETKTVNVRTVTKEAMVADEKGKEVLTIISRVTTTTKTFRTGREVNVEAAKYLLERRTKWGVVDGVLDEEDLEDLEDAGEDEEPEPVIIEMMQYLPPESA